jgi:hypothetical protein
MAGIAADDDMNEECSLFFCLHEQQV